MLSIKIGVICFVIILVNLTEGYVVGRYPVEAEALGAPVYMYYKEPEDGMYGVQLMDTPSTNQIIPVQLHSAPTVTKRMHFIRIGSAHKMYTVLSFIVLFVTPCFFDTTLGAPSHLSREISMDDLESEGNIRPEDLRYLLEMLYQLRRERSLSKRAQFLRLGK
ncbi:hypothetical protein SprV_0200911000 [Sparganum proliferum]